MLRMFFIVSYCEVIGLTFCEKRKRCALIHLNLHESGVSLALEAHINTKYITI